MNFIRKSIITSVFIIFTFAGLQSEELRHDIALELGSTYYNIDSQIALSAGLNYEYRFATSLPTGMGVMGTATMLTNPIIDGLLAFYIHPMKNMRVYFAGGVSIVDNGVAPPNTPLLDFKDYGQQVDILTRGGIDYNFQFDFLTIRPALNFNLLKDDFTVLFGLKVGMRF